MIGKNETVAASYDGTAPYYHLVYADWESSISRQAERINSVIRDTWGTAVNIVLDASCGIGTQALGLAELGYTVAARSLSWSS